MRGPDLANKTKNGRAQRCCRGALYPKLRQCQSRFGAGFRCRYTPDEGWRSNRMYSSGPQEPMTRVRRARGQELRPDFCTSGIKQLNTSSRAITRSVIICPSRGTGLARPGHYRQVRRPACLYRAGFNQAKDLAQVSAQLFKSNRCRPSPHPSGVSA